MTRQVFVIASVKADASVERKSPFFGWAFSESWIGDLWKSCGSSRLSSLLLSQPQGCNCSVCKFGRQTQLTPQLVVSCLSLKSWKHALKSLHILACHHAEEELHLNAYLVAFQRIQIFCGIPCSAFILSRVIYSSHCISSRLGWRTWTWGFLSLWGAAELYLQRRKSQSLSLGFYLPCPYSFCCWLKGKTWHLHCLSLSRANCCLLS